jgi:ribonucleotide monophosphatase NagD (HAD superfamily)
MIRSALRHLGVHSENTIMIGDRMDPDIRTGIESGMETVLVVSGVTHRPNFKFSLSAVLRCRTSGAFRILTRNLSSISA